MTGRALQGVHPSWNLIYNYLATSMACNDKIISLFFWGSGNHTGLLNKLGPIYFGLPLSVCGFHFNAPKHTVRTPSPSPVSMLMQCH